MDQFFGTISPTGDCVSFAFISNNLLCDFKISATNFPKKMIEAEKLLWEKLN